MNAFTYTAVSDPAAAVQSAATPGSSFIAGGTNLVDLWKLGAYPVSQLIDINGMALKGIQVTAGQLQLGALERMSDVGAHPDVVKNFPVVSQALLQSASPQLRNMASMGGNLMQRPRSLSYRNPDPNLRDGPNRFDAIFGVTPLSAAAHTSDLAVALLALDSSLQLRGPAGARTVKLSDFYRLPEKDLNLTTIQPGELITSITTGTIPFARRSVYVKIRDRASFQFAIVAAAVILDLDGGTIRDVRVAGGGVGTIPWRLPEVEEALKGKPASPETFQAAVADLGKGATTHEQNVYKVELLKRTVVRALSQAKEIV